ncbi:MAG: glycosyltransferase [Planctomycetes bacterium]|nr:glycosyltransferase [Planctomycetota bacterium]
MAERAEVGLLALAGPADLQRATAGVPRPWHYFRLLPHLDVAARRHRPGHRLRMLWHWLRLPLVAAKHWQPALPGAIDRALAEFRPDVVFVEMAQMAQYLRWLRGVPTVLTDHEAGVPANTRTGLGRFGDARDRRLWQRYLQRSYPLATALQAVTAEDAATLSAWFHRPVAARKPLVPVATKPVDVRAAPPHALFLGDYAHGPNPEAARAIVHTIWPQVRAAVPAAELWFAGQHQDRIADLTAVPGVRLLGFVPDLGALCAGVRLMLAPIYSGSGVRTKCIAALAHGVPVVTNALGARGCTAPREACRIAEDPAALAALAIEWLTDGERAARAGAAAHRWAGENVDAAAIARSQLALAEAAVRQFGAAAPRPQALPAGTP